MRCNSNFPCQWKGTVMVIIISEIVRVNFFPILKRVKLVLEII
jgi:hypothetical protein